MGKNYLYCWMFFCLACCTSKSSREDIADTTKVNNDKPIIDVTGDYKAMTVWEKDSSAIKGFINVQESGFDYHVNVSKIDDETALFRYDYRGPIRESTNLDSLNVSIKVKLSPTDTTVNFEEIWVSGSEISNGSFDEGVLHIIQRDKITGEKTVQMMAKKQ